MKKVLMLFVLLFTFSAATYAQTVYYKSTSDKVCVRTAPSLKSTQVQYADDGEYEGPVYLYKGDCVKCKGEVKNGFAKVYCMNARETWEYGWVSMQFLAKAVKCGKCGGKGHLNQPCGECEGYGCCCCAPGTDGKQVCTTCGGYGYK